MLIFYSAQANKQVLYYHERTIDQQSLFVYGVVAEHLLGIVFHGLLVIPSSPSPSTHTMLHFHHTCVFTTVHTFHSRYDKRTLGRFEGETETVYQL